jgi:hypothetical protein
MTETTKDKTTVVGIKHPSDGIYDKDLKRYVPMPKTDKGARFYVTPAGITVTKKGR